MLNSNINFVSYLVLFCSIYWSLYHSNGLRHVRSKYQVIYFSVKCEQLLLFGDVREKNSSFVRVILRVSRGTRKNSFS